MYLEPDFQIINNRDIVNIIMKTLNMIDERLVEHGARVSYIMLKMLEFQNKYSKSDIMSICMLAMLHDIGAFKTDEIDKLVKFDSQGTNEHSFFGYLFIKYLTPLSDISDAVLHHHTDFCDLANSGCENIEIAAMINLADRIDIIMLNSQRFDEKRFKNSIGGKFSPELFDLFISANKKYNIVDNIQNGYKNDLLKLFDGFQANDIEIFAYLKMLIYSIDFRSPVTVTHTFSTAIIAAELAGKLCMSSDEMQKIYFGAILHDIGKIKTPLEILEKPGVLTKNEMATMQQHVVTSREILQDYIDEEIVRIATRHHEKLNGAGYPDGLVEADLTLSEQIVAVADIVSALLTKRSYKDTFDRARIVEILKKMADDNFISKIVVSAFTENSDDIFEVVSNRLSAYIGIYERVMDEYAQLCNASSFK